MEYYCCSSCNKRYELKYKKARLKLELHMKTEGTVLNKYAIMKPELCEINNLLKNNVNIYDKRFELYKIVCKWKLVFENDISIDVKCKVMYRISALRHSLGKYQKNEINCYRRQGLEFSLLSETNITVITNLGFMTYKHYTEQPLPMVERILNRKLYNKITSL